MILIRQATFFRRTPTQNFNSYVRNSRPSSEFRPHTHRGGARRITHTVNRQDETDLRNHEIQVKAGARQGNGRSTGRQQTDRDNRNGVNGPLTQNKYVIRVTERVLMVLLLTLSRFSGRNINGWTDSEDSVRASVVYGRDEPKQ